MQRCLVLGSVLAMLSAACGGAPATEGSRAGTPAAPAPWALTVTPLAVPTGRSSMQPQITASARGVIASWVEFGDAGAALRFVERGPGDWSEPKTVATSEDWFITAADVPTVLRLSSGVLVASVYPTTDGDAEAYDTHLTYSRDDGRTWSAPVTPHRDGTTTQHGFVTLFETPGAGLGLVWLDGRAQKAPASDPDAGTMGLYFTQFDANWRQGPETLVNGRVCECCQTSVAATSAGLLTAFRDRSPAEVRDIAVTRLENGAWSAAQVVHPDNWTIQACPVNGPAVSARGNQVAVAWFTATGDTPRAFAAFSQDGGRTWSAPVRVDETSTEGKVDIELLADGSAAVSWVEFANQQSSLQVRRVEPSGTRSAPVKISTGFVRGYPRMVQWGGSLYFAWSEPGGIGDTMQMAVGRLPDGSR